MVANAHGYDVGGKWAADSARIRRRRMAAAKLRENQKAPEPPLRNSPMELLIYLNVGELFLTAKFPAA